MLEYKAQWYGRQFITINGFYPSSKLSFCGYKNGNLKLSDIEYGYVQNVAEFEHEADMILLEGLRQVGWGSPEPLFMGAMPVETLWWMSLSSNGYLKSHQSLKQGASCFSEG